MRSDRPTIDFVPVTQADLPLLHGWLKQPHLRQWWGEPDEELALIRSTLEVDDGTTGFVAHVEGEPVGYIQSWTPERFAGTHWVEVAPWIADVPAGTLGVDVFVGPVDGIGRGIGSAIVRAFCRKLFAEGAPRLIIDPDLTNGRAVRAYEKAGFRAYGRHEGADETTLLMELFPGDLAEAGT